MRFLALFAVSLLLTLPVPGQAKDCLPVFASGDQSVVVQGLEIEPGAVAIESFNLRVRNMGSLPENSPNPDAQAGEVGGGTNASCSAIIRVSRIDGPSVPDFPQYSIRGPGNQDIEILLDEKGNGTLESGTIKANVPSGGTAHRSLPFQIGVPTSWGLQAGNYTERLMLSLVDETGQVTDRSNLIITLVVPATVSIQLVGAIDGDVAGDGPARVDLGYLSRTAETISNPFAARILSTSPYLVRISSLNLGNLLHEAGEEQISYRLFFDGSPVSLQGGWELQYPEATPSQGDVHPMRIVVPPTTALAGRYSDRLVLTVSAI